MRKKLTLLAGVLALIATGLVLTLQAKPNPAPAPSPPQVEPPGGPTITWSVPELSQTLFPGTSTTTTIRFKSNRNLSNVAVWLTPSLNGVASTTPTAFSSIVANQDYQLAVTLTAPGAFQKRSFGGTIHLRNAAGHRGPTRRR